MKFYITLAGTPNHFQPDNHFAIIQFADFNIFLHEQPSVLPMHLNALEQKDYRGVGTILHFSCESVDTCAKELQKAGYTIAREPLNEKFGRRQMYIYDPDGYNIVIEEIISQPGI